MEDSLEILYQDEHFVAINKPTGMLIYKNKFTPHEHNNVLNLLQRQLRTPVHTIHRLDRSTSGVMIFAFTKEASTKLGEMFMGRTIEKKYLAIVRGHPDEKGEINEPLWHKQKNTFQQAISTYRTLDIAEIAVNIEAIEEGKYALVEVSPVTGRRHQIRRHLAKERMPIIGDKKYGDKLHNQLFAESWSLAGMMLHAYELKFEHPYIRTAIRMRANISSTMLEVCNKFNWNIE